MHLSEDAITEIFEALGDAITEQVKARVSGCSEFSVMADECMAINRREMVSVCIRMIVSDQQPKIIETFIGCWPVKATTAAEVSSCTIDGLESMSLKPNNIIAAAFDGAARTAVCKLC
jgi:hypothetical protein